MISYRESSFMSIKDITDITDIEAVSLCSKQEDHFFDKKAMEISGKKIQKIACAFANADGGSFVVGIKDDKEECDPNKRWDGAPSIEDFNFVFQSINEVSPSVDWNFIFARCDSKIGYILIVNIEKSSFVHKTSDDKVYQRFSAQSLPLTSEQVIELTYAKGTASFEDQTIKDAEPEEITDSKHISEFLQQVSPKTDPLDFIINQNLMDRKSWEPRCAGILLFNDNPSAVLPRKCAVKISRYETNQDLEREYLKEQYTVEGPIYILINETVSKITEIMSSVSIWANGKLKRVSYPPEAIWEIIVNSIIHRDYSISDDVQVLIYNNRIEVISPGKLPGYVTVDNILDARYSRNSKIVRILNRYKNPPNKDMGEGLNTAFEKMKEWKLKNPEILEVGNYIKVIIPHTSLAKPEEIIVEFLEENEMITNENARDLTGIKSGDIVKRIFNKLRDDGIIERVPGLHGRASAWRLKKCGQYA